MQVMSSNVQQFVPLDQRPFHERVAANVRAEMARVGVTQGQLATVLGITQQSVSAKRRGETPFTLNDLDRIAPVLGMTVIELIQGTRGPRGPRGGGVGPAGLEPTTSAV